MLNKRVFLQGVRVSSLLAMIAVMIAGVVIPQSIFTAFIILPLVLLVFLSLLGWANSQLILGSSKIELQSELQQLPAKSLVVPSCTQSTQSPQASNQKMPRAA